jgi:hypothetical protein
MPSKGASGGLLCPLVIVGALLAGGCTHTVEPPSSVFSAATVYLFDHGRTSSLVLPHAGRYARYSYGEWDWYAHNRTGLLRASGTLFSDTEAAVGRRVFAAAPNVTAVRRATRVPVERVWAIRVPAARVERLTAELDALFRAQPDQAVRNPRMALTFVPHPAPYSLTHNSNHMTAIWLRRLECRVVTRGPFSQWEVE